MLENKSDPQRLHPATYKTSKICHRWLGDKYYNIPSAVGFMSRWIMVGGPKGIADQCICCVGVIRDMVNKSKGAGIWRLWQRPENLFSTRLILFVS